VVDRIDLDTQITGDITGDLSEQDRDDLVTSCAKMAVLGKNLGCVRAVVQHRGTHFQTKVEPNGFKAQVVTFDRKYILLLKFSIAFHIAGGQPV
jgi:type I restriction enzyme R subunit